MLESFLYLSKNLRDEGYEKLKSSVVKISASIVRTSAFVNLFSLTFIKSLSSGGYISSYLVEISKAVTPNKCNYDFFISHNDKYLSIIFIVTWSVSLLSLNFLCTSIIHSTRKALEVSLISVYTLLR